ncbi:GNAT family N-acetyltransferase [Candidatus Nomurabacteria bacterium]|nr:GNAT family N-acetyltransferase [Candidatus Nomurabacteria bacterium]
MNNEEYMIRLAGTDHPEDRKQLIELWNTCFNDTPEFVDFFFSGRYRPENIVCAEFKGQITAAMHSLPVQLLIRGRPVTASLIAGVGTHPDHRGKGLMKDMFRFFLPELHRRGILTVNYHPVDFGIYRSMHHYPVSAYLHYSRIPIKAPGDSAFRTGPDRFLSPDTRITFREIKDVSDSMREDMNDCYLSVAAKYSGMVIRTPEYFKLKMHDYASSDAKALLHYSGGRISGYCIFFLTENEMFAEEVIHCNESTLQAMISSLNSRYSNLKTTIKLPPDTDTRSLITLYTPSELSFREQNAAGVTNISSFIKALAFSAYVPDELLRSFIVEVTDDFMPGNCGNFDLNGDHTDEPSVLRADIGDLVRFLYGYTKAAEMAVGSDDKIIKIANELDKILGYPVCRTIDEY